MRLALINNLHVDHLGFYYIAAVAKAAGWDVRLFLTDRSLRGNLRRFAPDAFAFTATTGNHGWVVDLADELRRDFPHARFFLGGPHPTYYPEIAETGRFDAVVRGEGEETFAEILDRLERGQSLADVRGAWVTEDGRLHRNPLREAPQDLDTLQPPDRSIYDDYPWLQAHRYPMMISSRGCPFHCTFCYSPTLMELMKGNGKFVRFRSVEHVVAEGRELRERFRPTIVEFVDDIFGMKRPWLREFADAWRREVRLPFNAQMRADLLDEESVALLAQAGCNALLIGLEAGSDRVRNEILKKDVSREDLRRSARLLRSHGIKFVTLNIMGSPGETLEDCLETVKLNQELKPDYAQVSVLVPFPRTKIYDMAVQAGQIEKDAPVDRFRFSFFERSPLVRDDLGGIINVQRMTGAAVRFPKLTPLVRWFGQRREFTPLYGLFMATHFLYYLQVKRVQWYYLMRLGMGVKELLRRHRAGVFAQFLPAGDRSADTAGTVAAADTSSIAARSSGA